MWNRWTLLRARLAVPASPVHVSVRAIPGSIYLLADSQTLFPSGGARSFADDARSLLAGSCAAYIGAANGDDPAFYGIFEAAMDIAGISDRHMIPSTCSTEHAQSLARADVIVVAGGDVRRGAEVLASTGMGQIIVDRHRAGAMIIGVSAGAVLLGQSGWMEDSESNESIISAEQVDALSLAPWMVDTHDEATGWSRLHRRLRQGEPCARGLGLPSGGGLIVHGDGSLQPLRRPILELTRLGDETVHSLLMPEIREVERPSLTQTG
jgi:cyanophycinase